MQWFNVPRNACKRRNTDSRTKLCVSGGISSDFKCCWGTSMFFPTMSSKKIKRNFL